VGVDSGDFFGEAIDVVDLKVSRAKRPLAGDLPETVRLDWLLYVDGPAAAHVTNQKSAGALR
jgi:hypothetical protein